MKPAFLLLAAMLLATSSALAANWHLLQNSSLMLLEADDPQLEANESSSQNKDSKKDKKLKIWSKSSYSKPEQARPGDFYYSSEKSLLEINCTKRAHRLLQKIYYAADGQEIKSVHQGEGEKSAPIVPDSTEERIYEFACTFQPKKADNKTAKTTHSKPAVSVKQPAPPEEKSKKPETKSAGKGKTPVQEKSTKTKPKDSATTKPQH